MHLHRNLVTYNLTCIIGNSIDRILITVYSLSSNEVGIEISRRHPPSTPGKLSLNMILQKPRKDRLQDLLVLLIMLHMTQQRVKVWYSNSGLCVLGLTHFQRRTNKTKHTELNHLGVDICGPCALILSLDSYFLPSFADLPMIRNHIMWSSLTHTQWTQSKTIYATVARLKF